MISKLFISVICFFAQTKDCGLIKINGCSGGDIPVSLVSKTTQLEIQAGYIFESATLYIAGENLEDPAPFRLFSAKFNADLIGILKKMETGQHIVIDEIRIKKKNGNYEKCSTIGFKLVK
jgi:hypothetical protein